MTIFYDSPLISLSQLRNFDRDPLVDKLPLLLWLFYKLDPLVALLACTTTITIYSLDEDIWDFESACYTLYNIQLCQKSFWQLEIICL